MDRAVNIGRRIAAATRLPVVVSGVALAAAGCMSRAAGTGGSAASGTPIPLRNAGFEDAGGPDGGNPSVARHWQNTDGRVHPQWYEVDTGIRRSGVASQRMRYVPGVSDPWGTVWQFTPTGSVVPGRRYGASAWCRVEGITGASRQWGGLRLAIRFLDADQRVLSESRAPLDSNADHDWRRIRVSAEAPTGAERIQIVLYLHSEAGTVWYDDAEIRELPPTAP